MGKIYSRRRWPASLPAGTVEPEEMPPMAQEAAAGSVTRARALAWGVMRHVRKAPVLAACLLIGLGAAARAADPIRGEATLAAGRGFARLVITRSEDVSAEVTPAGSILI